MIYYYEASKGFGSFNAVDDKEAIRMIRTHWMFVYRENKETKDGTPFITIFERSMTK